MSAWAARPRRPNMKRSYIIIIAVSAAILLLVGWLLLFLPAQKKSAPANNSGLSNANANIPSLILTPEQENYIKLLVQIDVEGYNTYGYLDARPLQDLQANAAPALAASIQQILDAVRTDPKYQAYQVTTTAEPSSFSYQYPEVGTLNCQMDAQVQINDNSAIQQYPVHAALTLINQNNLWLLDKIELQKK